MSEPLPSVITDSSGQRYFLTKGGYLRPMGEWTYEWHFVSAGMVPLRKGLVDPMQFVALFPPLKPGEFGV